MAVAQGLTERVPIALSLQKGAPLTFWLLQPRASELSTHAPYHHAVDSPGRPLDLLRAAIAVDAQQKVDGPVLFVVPMIYVHVAENHRREIPESVAAAASTELDPDRRILRMLGARGSHVAAGRTPKTKEAAEAAS